MSADTDRKDPFKPDKLLTGFAKTPISFYVVIAIGLHVLFVGATSVRYIRDTYVDPEGAKLRLEAKKKAEEDARKEKNAPPPTASEAEAKPEADKSKDGEETPAAAKGSATDEADKPAEIDQIEGTDRKLTKEQKESSVIKEITKVAKPEEIPASPDELPINFDDTN